jgi:MSHA biogenesis protein MshI
VLRGFPVLSLFRKKRFSDLRAGIATAGERLAAAVVRRRPQGRPLLLQSTTGTVAESAATLEKLQIDRAPVSAVIGAEDYQLVQIEAPDVLPAELRAAVRWRLRDAIDFPVEEATVDLLELPPQSRRANGKMVYAVAARTEAVERLGNSLSRQAPGFDVIDVPELCLRNLSALLPQDQKGVALLMLREEFAQLVLTKKGVLYLTRRIELGVRSSEDLDPSVLALELQRSLDYYETHYDQAPIGELVLAPDSLRIRALAAALRTEVGLNVTTFDVSALLDIPDGVEVPSDWLALTALGAALRSDGPGG